jgi:hypothetical protein
VCKSIKHENTDLDLFRAQCLQKGIEHETKPNAGSSLLKEHENTPIAGVFRAQREFPSAEGKKLVLVI